MQLPVEKIPDTSISIVQIGAAALDAGNAADFKTSIAPLCSSGVTIILDLSSLKFVDSSGLGAMLSILRLLNGMSGDLKLCGMSKSIRALFELVRMHRVFEIFNSREEALRSLGVVPAGEQTEA